MITAVRNKLETNVFDFCLMTNICLLLVFNVGGVFG